MAGRSGGALLRELCEQTPSLEMEVATTVIDRLGRETGKDLNDDFHGDTSRWEMSRLIPIAVISQSKLPVRQSINRITGTDTQPPEQDRQHLFRVVHYVARRILPARTKHDEPRSGCPTSAQAVCRSSGPPARLRVLSSRVACAGVA